MRSPSSAADRQRLGDGLIQRQSAPCGPGRCEGRFVHIGAGESNIAVIGTAIDRRWQHTCCLMQHFTAPNSRAARANCPCVTVTPASSPRRMAIPGLSPLRYSHNNVKLSANSCAAFTSSPCARVTRPRTSNTPATGAGALNSWNSARLCSRSSRHADSSLGRMRDSPSPITPSPATKRIPCPDSESARLHTTRLLARGLSDLAPRCPKL